MKFKYNFSETYAAHIKWFGSNIFREKIIMELFKLMEEKNEGYSFILIEENGEIVDGWGISNNHELYRPHKHGDAKEQSGCYQSY